MDIGYELCGLGSQNQGQGERLQGVRLPLVICLTVELAGNVQTVVGLASFGDVVERVSSWTNRSESGVV